MRKTLKNKSLNGRTWLAMTLAISLAAIGCTTNRTPGEGEPYIGGPGVGPSAPSSRISSSRATTVTPPPMTSSYQRDDAAPGITTRASSRLPLSPDEAAAILAQQQPRVRVLGPSNPGVTGGYYSDAIVTGLVRDSASITNPQVTINSSLTSPPTEAISSGVGGSGVAATGVVVAGSSITAMSTTGVVTTNDGSAPVFTRDLRTATPTTAAIPVTPGMFAAGGTNLSAGAARTTATRRAPTPVTGSTTSSSTVRVPVRTTTSANSSVKVVNTNGRLVMTNTSNQ